MTGFSRRSHFTQPLAFNISFIISKLWRCAPSLLEESVVAVSLVNLEGNSGDCQSRIEHYDSASARQADNVTLVIEGRC